MESINDKIEELSVVNIINDNPHIVQKNKIGIPTPIMSILKELKIQQTEQLQQLDNIIRMISVNINSKNKRLSSKKISKILIGSSQISEMSESNNTCKLYWVFILFLLLFTNTCLLIVILII